MMQHKTLSLLKEIKQLGGHLWREEDYLRYQFPQGRLTSDLLDKIKQHKSEIINIMQIIEQKKQNQSKQETGTNKSTLRGYSVLGKHEKNKLMQLKNQIIKAKICSFDYESNSDPDDKTQDPQDTDVVGVSVSYRIGEAFYYRWVILVINLIGIASGYFLTF